MNECFLGLSGSKAAKLSASLTLWFDALDLCFCAFVNSPSFSVEQLVILKRQTFGQVWKPLSDLDLFESSCRRRCFSCPIRSSFWSLKHTITTLSLCRFSVISAPLWAVTWRNVIFLTAVQSVRFFFFFFVTQIWDNFSHHAAACWAPLAAGHIISTQRLRQKV